MPKKTAKQTKKRRADSLPEQSGLIAKGKISQQSATTKSTLDNRSHRTTLQISCVRSLSTSIERSAISVPSKRANEPHAQRVAASCAG